MKTIDIDKLKVDPSVNVDDSISQEYIEAFERVSKEGGSILDYLSARAIFEDHTLISDEASAQAASRACMKDGTTAIIERDPKYGLVFHTLIDNRNDRTYRKKIASRFRLATPNKARTELDVEHAFCASLTLAAVPFRRQVACAAGRADVVTGTHVYEIENTMSRLKLFEAVGQAMLYRQAIDPSLTAAVVGIFADDAKPLIPFANAIGVKVVEWNR